MFCRNEADRPRQTGRKAGDQGIRRHTKRSGPAAIAIGENIARLFDEAALHRESGEEKEDLVAPRRLQGLRNAVGARRFDEPAAGFIGNSFQISRWLGDDYGVGDEPLYA